MKRACYIYALVCLIILLNTSRTFSQPLKNFETEFTTIHYSDERQLNDFLWKVGRTRLGPHFEASLAQSRVDRLVERVQDVLNMYPEDFHIDIRLYSDYESGIIAFYSEKTGSITVYVERVTDGVLAHEIAHAVMREYFGASVSRKAQEILCQYVDANLWQDYY